MLERVIVVSRFLLFVLFVFFCCVQQISKVAALQRPNMLEREEDVREEDVNLSPFNV